MMKDVILLELLLKIETLEERIKELEDKHTPTTYYYTDVVSKTHIYSIEG